MDAGRCVPMIVAVLGLLLNGAILPVEAQEPFSSSGIPRGDVVQSGSATPINRSSRLPLPISLETLPKSWQESILKVMQQPNLTALAPIEEFHSSVEMYLWLLDHPERTTLAWKRLKIASIDIRAMEGSRFIWQDEQGSELVWRSVAKNADGRLWYAEGKVRPGALLPLIPVRAVAVLQHRTKKDADGDQLIRHQVEIYLQTDSKFAALATRILGPAAPKMAEQGAEQLLLFFSGIARYADRHPDKVQELLEEQRRAKP